jgi:hypothetical protein
MGTAAPADDIGDRWRLRDNDRLDRPLRDLPARLILRPASLLLLVR